MVNGQLRVGSVTDLNVLAAFLETPREAFSVAAAHAGLAYLDCDQPALGSSGRPPAGAADPGPLAAGGGGRAGRTGARCREAARDTAPRFWRILGASVVALESDAGAADAARRALAGHAAIEVVEGDLALRSARQGAVRRHSQRQRRLREPAGGLGRSARRRRAPCRRRSAGGAQEAVLIEKSGAGIGQRSLFETRVRRSRRSAGRRASRSDRRSRENFSARAVATM